MHQSEKVKIWKALKKMKPSPSGKSSKETVGNRLQQLPLLTESTNLQDLVGPDSWTTLHKFGELEFIEKHPKQWRNDPSYQKMCDLVKSMPVINDSAERVLGLVSSYYSLKTTPKTVEQKQNLFKTIHHYRHQQRKLATSSERCTKHVMANFDW